MTNEYQSHNVLGNNLEMNLNTRIQGLKNDVENTTSFRLSLCSLLNISDNKKENSSIGNFSLGIIDGLMEFPIIVEMYINNEKFRELFWQEIKKISFGDLMSSFDEIGKQLTRGDWYQKGKGSTRTILFLSGIGGLLRQFGYVIVKNSGKISFHTASISAGVTSFHGIGYAIENRTKNILKENQPKAEEILKNLPL